MGARTKLNVAYVNGSLFVSALLGILAGSWAIFEIALLVSLTSGIYAGEIRPRSSRR